ncbi:uncharacterized protein TNCV_2018091 [Trichonephila clavipes]|nr:uncharacterized protein TNCV_2018091 [Trichonephila clavipes]
MGPQFLCEFAYAIRTAVNETTGKTPAELFLGRKLITLFQKLVMVSDGTEFAIDQGERHTGKADKRGPFIRSPPGSWSESSRKLKRRRKENIGYKRSRESGSGGPERKIKKGLEHRVAKRALSSNYSNDLPKLRKKGRTEETVMPSTSGSSQEQPRQALQPLHRSQLARIPEEEVVNNKMARKGKEERIPTDPSPWRS